MIGKLNHVGVATPSIEDSVRLYRDLLGATSITDKFALPEQGVWVCFVNLPNSQIELIEPYGEGSPIHGFLAKNPKGGQHHVCFEVPDIYAARDEMRAKGATVLGTGEPKRRSLTWPQKSWPPLLYTALAGPCANRLVRSQSGT